MIPSDAFLAPFFVTHIRKITLQSTIDHDIIDLIRYSLPVNRNLTHLLTGAVLEYYTTNYGAMNIFKSTNLSPMQLWSSRPHLPDQNVNFRNTLLSCL